MILFEVNNQCNFNAMKNGSPSLIALFKEHLRRITLEERIQRNPIYPFLKVPGGEGYQNYQLEIRQNEAYYCMASTLICTISIIICGNLAQYEYLTVFSFVLFSSMYLTLEYWPMVRVVINHNKQCYSVHKGRTMVYEGKLHNIALKMTEQGSSATLTYQVILVAYLLEIEIPISCKMKDRDKLKHSALELAENLQINYFDSHKPSKTHVVRHRRE